MADFLKNHVAKHGISRANWLKLGCALGALAAPAAGMAQQTVAAEGAEAGLEEIVVTAQRRTERLIDVPMAVTALTSAALERANIVNIHDIGQIAAGVQINYNGSANQPTIRGVTTLTNGTGNENNIATYVDGFYVPDNTSINIDLANIESVQVLKGPQGTLYGRNATGGAILINTLAPSDVLKGKFEGSYARFNEKNLRGYISAPLSDSLRFIVAGAYRNSDGWLKKSDPANNQRNAGPAARILQRAVRAKLEADVSDSIKATVGLNYSMNNDGGVGIIFTPYGHIAATVPGGNLRAVRRGTSSFNKKSISSTRTNEATLKLEFDTPLGPLTSYTSYAKRSFHVGFDVDGTYSDLSYIDSNLDQKVFQQAADLVINTMDRLDLLVGGMYFKEKFRQQPGVGQVTFTNGVPTARVFRPRRNEAWAFYADATYELTDKLFLGVGGRYSHENRRVEQFNTRGDITQITIPRFVNEKSFKRFTPRATIRYEIADRTNIYASYSKGFRTGSFNTSAAASQALDIPIKPEDIHAFEVGIKAARAWYRFEVSGYYYDYKNLNVSLTVPNPTCAGQPICPPSIRVGNAPKAEVYGIDAQIVASPIDNLNVTIGGAWIHARYGRFANAIGVGVNAANTLNVSNQVQDWTGKQMVRAPNFSANLGFDYSVPIADGKLRLSGNVAYSDSYVLSNASLFGPLAPAPLQGKQRFRQKATTIVNGEVTWFAADDRYWVGVYGKNLTNLKYRLINTGSASGDTGQPAAPISYGVKVGYRF